MAEEQNFADPRLEELNNRQYTDTNNRHHIPFLPFAPETKSDPGPSAWKFTEDVAWLNADSNLKPDTFISKNHLIKNGQYPREQHHFATFEAKQLHSPIKIL